MVTKRGYVFLGTATAAAAQLNGRPAQNARLRRSFLARRDRPEKSDSRAARLRRGARVGRPPGFDEDRYKKRNGHSTA